MQDALARYLKESGLLDVYPIPKDTSPLYINEPWLIDGSLLEISNGSANPEQEQDNVRVYIPMDIKQICLHL